MHIYTTFGGFLWLSVTINCGNYLLIEDYLLAMERSSIKDNETKHILNTALTDDIHSHEVYMKGIDHSYYYEGYTTFKTEDL